MSEDLRARLLFAATVAGIVLLGLGLGLVTRREGERFRPIYYAAFLPLFLFVGLPFLMLLRSFAARYLLMLALHVLLTAAVYDLLLLALTPLLRKAVSAEGCAALWLLPNLLLYCCLSIGLSAFRLRPRFLIHLPRSLFCVLLGLWAAGFAVSLTWRIVSHLRFRRELLRDAEAAGPREEALLKEVRGALKAKNTAISPRLLVLRSPAAASPLSVGLLRSKTCLVLPQKDYSDEELRLIFRHELIHLLHRDNRLKLTQAVICAAGWFIPSLRAGTGKAAEELELCCDELATEGMAEDERRRYADLLLKNAGTARGFTTCLSATASGLRYRMARVLHPKKRRFGVLATSALAALFAFCFGLAGFALEAGSFRTELLERDGGGWQINRLMPSGSPFTEQSASDPALCAAAEAALAEVGLAELPDQTARSAGQLGWLELRRGEETAVLTLYEDGFDFSPEGMNGRQRICYRYLEPVDLAPLLAEASVEPPAASGLPQEAPEALRQLPEGGSCDE